MALNFDKVTYVDGSTIIGEDNLNDIQDAILALDENKVDVDGNKVLSDNNYDSTDKGKVDALENTAYLEYVEVTE